MVAIKNASKTIICWQMEGGRLSWARSDQILIASGQRIICP